MQNRMHKNTQIMLQNFANFIFGKAEKTDNSVTFE